MSASTISLGLSARAPRQSGLKKPRPLRSVSLQESSDSTTANYAAFPVNKEKFPQATGRSLDRSISNDEGLIDGRQIPLPRSDSDQELSVCPQISAMSTMIASQAFKQGPSEQEFSYNICQQLHIDTTPVYRGRDSSSSSSSQSHRASFDSDIAFKSAPSSFSPNAKMDINFNKADPFHCISLEGFQGISKYEERDAGHELDTDMKSSTSSLETHSTGRRKYHRNSDAPAGMKSSAILSEGNRENHEVKQSCSEHSGNITMATLMTKDGEELILSGRNIKVILSASRALLTNPSINASIIRLETVSDSEPEKLVQSHSSTDMNNSSNQYLKDSSFAERDQSSRSQKCLKYSKKELLALSDCPEAREPPDMWNILSHTHSQCCLPAGKVVHYFHPSQFRAHDGTFVVEEHRQFFRQERKD